MSAPLGFVVCGAPLAVRAPDVARALVADGRTLAVGVSEAATEWVDPDALTDASQSPAATRRRRASQERRTERPDRVVAFPLTFNTANKITSGIMDTHVTGTLCDALAVGAPILATLMVSDRLWGHPAWLDTLGRLTDAGMAFIDPRTGDVGAPQPVPSGTGAQIVTGFDPAWVVRAVAGLDSQPRA